MKERVKRDGAIFSLNKKRVTEYQDNDVAQQNRYQPDRKKKKAGKS